MTKKPRVYIEDFEMPKCCKECPAVMYWEYDNETSCKLSGRFLWNATPNKTRHPNCPLKVQQ